MSDYTNGSQQLLLRVLDALGDNPLKPKSTLALVDQLGEPRDKIFRACQNLVEAGWAGQVASGWLLSPKLTIISERLRINIADLHNHYLDIKQ